MDTRKKETKLSVFVLLSLTLTLSSCSSLPPERLNAEKKPIEAIEEVSREAVFIYEPKATSPLEVTLKLGGEPILLGNIYLRLVGVIKGESPIALIEAGGRSQGVEEGKKIFGYNLAFIGEDNILLKK